MSRLCGWAAAIATALSACVAAESVVAQDSSPPPAARAPAGPTVALLDVGYVFKNCTHFKAMMDEMKRDLERFKSDAQAQKNSIVQLGERLQEFRSGTADYQALDAEIAKRQAEFTATFQLRNREFARREAKIWHDVYKEICDAANDYMQQHNIDIVLRFNGDPVDPEQIDSVREFVGRSVVSYRTDLDITPAILQYVNRSASNRPAPGQQPKESFR